jgi:hypothetical protein
MAAVDHGWDGEEWTTSYTWEGEERGRREERRGEEGEGEGRGRGRGGEREREREREREISYVVDWLSSFLSFF